MREFIEEAYEHRQDGVGRVQAADKAPLMKRFYKAVTVEPTGDAFAILLDGKNMKTPSGKPVHILLTKADKLSRQQASAQLAEVRHALHSRGPGCSAQLFSSLKRTGVEEVETVLLSWLELGEKKEAPPV